MNLITPDKLKKGDKVAVVAPSWAGAHIYYKRYLSAKKAFEETFGLTLVEMPHALASHEESDANPKMRADDIMLALKTSEIKGILSTIGGDDCVRLLPYLDFEVIRNNPKPFIGFSDTTALLSAFVKAGVRAYYGPSLLCNFAEEGGIDTYTRFWFEKALMSEEPLGEITPSDYMITGHVSWEKVSKKPRPRIKNSGWKFIQGEKPVSGHLLGGCIEVLEMIKGTRAWFSLDDFENAVLFIDLSEEMPTPTYVTRCLRSYAAAGILQKISAILLSRPYCDVPENTFSDYDDAVLRAVSFEAGLTRMPVVTRMNFGHVQPVLTLEYGATCHIDPQKELIEIV